ncbi:hypothetical protein J6X90_03525 [Candidatus Saccharibacteria bacterium]|nr:hypothetical protein [Candidatus Saccharibacteria bacterium]
MKDKFKKVVAFLKKHADKFLIAYVIIFCSAVALFTYLDSAPDEMMRYDVVKYIAETSTIPHGGEESIRNNIWGFSYAFQPITSQIISGFIMHTVTLFTWSWHIVMFSVRSVSVLWLVVYAIFVLKISKKLFKADIYRTLFVLSATLIPQVLYMGGYINNDSMGLATIAMIIYGWLLGIENKWNYKSCIFLGISIGLCALSYYNAYGYMLMSVVLFFAINIARKARVREILKKGVVISVIAILIAGWWFARSAMLYNGDIFGLKSSREYGEQYALEEYKPSNRTTPAKQGVGLKDMLLQSNWTESTRRSFYGNFGYMNHPMNYELYEMYEIFTGIGLIGGLSYLIYYSYLKLAKKQKELKKLEPFYELELDAKKKEQKIFGITMVLSIVIVVGLSLYYSYYNDYQPQGRYLLPMVIPLMFFVVKGHEFLFKDSKAWLRKVIAGIFIALLLFAPLYELTQNILKYLSY